MTRTVADQMRLQDEALDQIMEMKTAEEKRIIIEDLELEQLSEREQRNRLHRYFENLVNLRIPWGKSE
jgi:hypothetical protein